MIIDSWISQSTSLLSQAGVSTARLDALVLLEDVLGKDRSWLLAHGDSEISSADQATLKKLLSQRAKHLPLAYVRGKTEFYGREFIVSSAVLEPRPESETMLDELKKLDNLPAEPLVGDIGTGSGALGITAKLELPKAQLHLIDIDAEALKVAQMNVDLFTIEARLQQQSLLENDETAYDVLLCNLPYVPDSYQINTAASHEPELAIFGGPDGLAIYRQLFQQLSGRSKKVLYILTESLPLQHEELRDIARHNHYEQASENDFIQLFRWIQK